MMKGKKNGKLDYSNRWVQSAYSHNQNQKLPLSVENDRFRDLNNTALSTSSCCSSYQHQTSLIRDHKTISSFQKQVNISPLQIEESIEDSLEQFRYKKPKDNFQQRIKILAMVFELLKQLKSDEKDRTLSKQLSKIENILLSLERDFLQEQNN